MSYSIEGSIASLLLLSISKDPLEIGMRVVLAEVGGPAGWVLLSLAGPPGNWYRWSFPFPLFEGCVASLVVLSISEGRLKAGVPVALAKEYAVVIGACWCKFGCFGRFAVSVLVAVRPC